MSETMYKYKTVTVTKENDFGDISIEAEANYWAKQGWRVVSVIPKTGFLTGIHQIMLERPLQPPPNVDLAYQARKEDDE